METTYDFLEALGLDEAAQERDIRRAYARKLKLIDQEREPDAFQALRDAYEVALDWARWKLAQEAQQAPNDTPADAPADTPAADASVLAEARSPAAAAPPRATAAAAPPPAEPVNPAQLGAEVYHRFLADASALVALPKHGEVSAWRAAIEARFGDDELVNIDARIYFEAYIASLLASGWHPGHEILFIAAQEAFGWDEDSRGLRQLGQAGRMLDQAIEERRLFEALQPTERTRVRDLVKMLRQQELPATRRIRAAMPDVERMLERFPAFMAVIAPMENVERWRAVYRDSGGPPIVVDAEETIAPPAEPKRTFTTLQGALLVLVLFAVLRAMFNHAGGEQGAGSGGFFPPGAQQQMPAVPQEVLDRVVPPVRYTPPPQAKAGKLEVVYKVFLNFDNKVERVQNWQTSGDPGFDAAVGDALRKASPFPAGTPREFSVQYSTTVERDARLPKAGGNRTLMPELPLSEAELRAHLPPIRFVPSPDAKEGTYRGRYRVYLDHDGKVNSVKTIEASGDPRLDRAVNLAFWAAKPFPGGFRSFDFTYSTRVFRKPAAPEGLPGDGQAQPEVAATPPETDVED